MPLIDGLIHPYNQIDREGLARAITRAVVEALKEGFSRQLGFVGPDVKPIAEEVIGRFAPGWVWVHLDDFKAYVAGAPPKVGDVMGRFDVAILNGALDNEYMQGVVNAVARAASFYLKERHGTPDLAISLAAGNVRMSTPGQPDSLLTPQGVHEFLVAEIVKEIRARASGAQAAHRDARPASPA